MIKYNPYRVRIVITSVYLLLFILNVSAVSAVSVANITQITHGTDISNSNPSWSPDGARIAYSAGSGYNYSIWVMNADGSNPVKLTTGFVDTKPRWTPDGSKIVFQRRVYKEEISYGEFIYIMNSDGSGQKKLIDGGIEPGVSPDGRYIVFVSGGTGGISTSPDQGLGIYVMDIDGTNVKMLTGDIGNEIMPSWSPDGKKIVFTKDGIIHIMNADGSNVMSTGQEGYYPKWCPNGTHISFSSERAGDTYQNIELNHLYIMDIDGTNVTQLTSDNGRRDSLSDWSPDGTKMVFYSKVPSAASGANNIYMMKLDLNTPEVTQKSVTESQTKSTARILSIPGFSLLVTIISLFVMIWVNRIKL